MLRNNWRVASYFAMVLLLLLTVAPALADSDVTTAEAAPDAEGAAEASVDEDNDDSADNSTQAAGGGVSTALSRLSVHGYLTQAWATADFLDIPLNPLSGEPASPSPRREEVSLGIPEDGTTNYRFLALQFRYDISDKDVFVVQFSSRTLGFSPLQEFEEEVELDWAFYERRIGDDTSLKVGRIQIPVGIYNEVRDVGTVLPFYRPAFIFYREGAFTTETVDGISLSHTFFAESDWSLEATGYAGEWDSIFIDPLDQANNEVRLAQDGFGAQLWLNTPLSGLRFGAGLLSWSDSGDRRKFWHASLDGAFNRFTLQAEWGFDEGIEGAAGGIVVEATTYYLLAGFNVTDKFKIWGQIEEGDVDLDIEFLPLLFPIEMNFRQDVGIALNYAFQPNLVLKAEHHWVEEEEFFLAPDFSTGGFALRPSILEVPNGSYTIVALSVSF